MVLKVYLYGMGKRVKIVLISLAVLIVLGVVGIIIAQNVMTSKIENFLATSLPKNIKVNYENLDLSILSGRLQIDNPDITSYGKTTDSVNLKVTMKYLKIDDFSIWNYLFSDNISIDAITFQEPKVIYYQNKLIDSKYYTSSKTDELKNDISIGHLNIVDGDVKIYDVQSDSLIFKTQGLEFDLMKIEVNKDILKEKMPFHFEDYNLSFSNLFYSMNAYDNLEIQDLKFSKAITSLNHLKLYTKYSKQKLSSIIPKERDHYDLSIDKIEVHNQEFGYHKDSIFFFKSPRVQFTNPILNIYRDKLITDDPTIKSMYSKMLRTLKFDLTLSEILLKNTTINYSERVKPEGPAGVISFTNLDANIRNVGNTYAASKNANVDIDAIFMKSTPIKVNWYFDVNNVNDQFIFKAEVGRLPAQDLNPFSVPNLKVKFEGELLKTYFTIDGNLQNSNVDLRTNYDDFKVAVLDKEGKGKNTFLSVVANLFIKKDSNEESDNFREGAKTDVERDKTKSVFNFLWLNARSGLLSALTGNGKK